MSNRTLPRCANASSSFVAVVDACSLVTLFFSLIRYVLNSLRRPEWTSPSLENWRGFGNYEYVIYQAKDFWFAVQNSLFIVTSVIILTVGLGWRSRFWLTDLFLGAVSSECY